MLQELAMRCRRVRRGLRLLYMGCAYTWDGLSSTWSEVVPSSLVRSTRRVSEEEHPHYWAVLHLVHGSRRAATEGQGLGLGGVE